MSIKSSPRALGLSLLQATLQQHRPLDDSLEALTATAGLEPRDRAFVRVLAATVLRRLGQLDEAIDACLERPGAIKPEVRDLLRLGAAQLLFLETPPHAAVSTAVELVAPPYKGLINAVLRRLAREGAGRIAGQDAARLNTPEWLWLSWQRAYGADTARAIAAVHLTEAPLDLSLRDSTPEALAAWAERLEARLLPTGTLRRAAGGAITDLPGFAEGAWWVQDAAAALPARLLHRALGDLAGKRIFDLCAAPGGKTAQLAAAGAQVIALDRGEARLARLRANLQRLRLQAETITADATTWSPQGPLADGVLLDAPCSATGTIRRHPDISRLKSPSEVTKLARLQARLLARAVALTKPGGILVYTVCSLQPEEGEQQIRSLLAAGAPVEPLPVSAEDLPGYAESLTAEGWVRTLPCHFAGQGGIDGFFIARLRVRA
jgi:16S rRNA (cytosine967-C5)-methyltransferase